MRLGFSKLLGTLSCVKTCIDLLRVHYKKDQKRTFDDDYAIFFPDFLHEGIYCGYSFELHRLVDAIQMSTHKICLYKEVDKKYTGCNLKTTKLLDCALIGVHECVVIRSNTVCGYPLLSVAMSTLKERSCSLWGEIICKFILCASTFRTLWADTVY